MMKLACHATETDPYTLPAARPGLEEAAAAVAADWAQAAAFALERARGQHDPRPVLFVATVDWMRERGRLSPRGLLRLGIAPRGLILVRADRDQEALWALEEGLKSGAISGAVGTVKAAAFVATRRLDFAARAGRATAVLLRAEATGDLSVARLRWQVSAQASAPHPDDPAAPGAMRLTAGLTRRRDGPLGAWTMEQDDETHRLRLAAGLADHGLVQGRRTAAAA
jgi:protein ImuA